MVHEFTIANGLKVIGIESHKSPVVSVQMWVRNGSADERQGDEGLSHFIEHLVFKGSKKYKMGEIAALVESCGGELNAYTSFDQTVFYVTLSKNFFKTALDVVSEMVGYPRFDGNEIDKEREVVIEEIKRSQDSLSRRASRLMFSTVYKGYPYERPVIGYDEVIRTISHERIKSFYKERYVPRNMFLIVTGDFEAATLRKDVESHFGDIVDRPVQLPARGEVPRIDKKWVAVEEAPFEESLFYLNWQAVDINHQDLPALETLSLILGQGGSSRLNRRLRLKDHSVNYVGAGIWAPRHRGFLSINGSLNPDKYDVALLAIKEEIEELLTRGVTEEELHKAKTNFLSDEAYSIETVGGLARKYGSNEDLVNDIHFHLEFFKKLELVTAEEVVRVAREYLRPETMVAIAVTPKDSEKIRQQLQSWTFNNKMATVSGAQSKAPVKRIPSFKMSESVESSQTKIHQLPNGARVLMRTNSSAPIFHMRMACLSGSRAVPEAQAGLTELLRRTWCNQTKNKSEDQLRGEIDSLASSVHCYAGRNTIGTVVDGLSGFQSELAELAGETLIEGVISDEVIHREKKMVYESIRSRKDNPANVAILNFQKSMFQDHPYGIDSLGTEETVDALRKNDLEIFLKKYLNPKNMVFGISGYFDESLWLDKIKRITAALPDTAEVVATVPHRGPQDNIMTYEHAQKEQANIVYGFKGMSLTDPDRFALQIVEAVLAGQGGRLFIELRDKASLAYSVSPIKLEGLETGYFGAYIGCSPEKTQTAIEMMKIEFDKLTQSKVTDIEMQRAKNYLLGSHDIDLQKNSALATGMCFNTLYGLPMDELFDYQRFLAGITVEDILRVSQKIFSQPRVISIVGPERPPEGS